MGDERTYENPVALRAVVSTDAMLYGSLVGSRMHDLTAEKIMHRAEQLKAFHESHPRLPLYAFGYGLSYTRFAYESLTMDRDSLTAGESLTVTVTVRNIGNRPGREAVQLYIRDLVASVVRPVQQLIDYRKVSLAPGEAKEVSFTVTEEQLRFWNYGCQFISEPGVFEISTGYADHLLLTKRFNLV